MIEILTADIGGTHARFALASIADGEVRRLTEAFTLRTADHATLSKAVEEFARQLGRALPRDFAFAIAGSVAGDVIRFTNNNWFIHRETLGVQLNAERITLVNDFEAVAHAVAQADAASFMHLCGPDVELPKRGTISVIGPGTGLGAAHLWRDFDRYRVQATEGGHLDFAPLDEFEDSLLVRLRNRYGRVSVERVVSGPGLLAFYETIAEAEDRPISKLKAEVLWQQGISGEDLLARAAIHRFCLSLGSAAGDLTLAQGGSATVVAGGLGLRLREILPTSGFAGRYRAKGRFENLMASYPVRLIVHPQPGLLGAAAAFAKEYA